jgi:hypothetical protein
MFIRRIVNKKYITNSIVFRFSSAYFNPNRQCVDFPCITKKECIKLGRCNLQSTEHERSEDKNDSSTNSTNVNINFNDNYKNNDININFDFRKDKQNQNNTETNILPYVIERDDVTESVGQTFSNTISDVADSISDFDD